MVGEGSKASILYAAIWTVALKLAISAADSSGHKRILFNDERRVRIPIKSGGDRGIGTAIRGQNI